MTKQVPPRREAIYFHYPNYAFHKKNLPGAAIRAGRHKLIRRFGEHPIELYDLQADIGEQNNLAETMPDLRDQMLEQLNLWLETTGARIPQAVKD